MYARVTRSLRRTGDVCTGRWATECSGTNPSLVFAPTDLSILARCTIVYVTTLEGETEWSTDDRKGVRRGEGTGEGAVRRRGTQGG